MRGEPAAAGLGAVDDVVVHERGRVDELDHGRVENRAVAGVAAEAGRQQQHGGAHALAAAHLDVLAHLRDQLDARLEVASELALDLRELLADRFEDLGEPRNGRRGRIAGNRSRLRAHPRKTCPNETIGYAGCQRAVGAEQRVEVARDQSARFLDAAPPGRRHDPCRFRHPRRLVALAAVRHGRQKRRVGFNQQAIVGDERGDVPQLLGLRKRDDAGEGDEEPQIQRPPRLVDRTAEAVHDAAQPARPRFSDHGERVVGRLARVDDDRQRTFERDGHLRAKHVAAGRPRGEKS